MTLGAIVAECLTTLFIAADMKKLISAAKTALNGKVVTAES